MGQTVVYVTHPHSTHKQAGLLLPDCEINRHGEVELGVVIVDIGDDYVHSGSRCLQNRKKRTFSVHFLNEENKALILEANVKTAMRVVLSRREMEENLEETGTFTARCSIFICDWSCQKMTR